MSTPKRNTARALLGELRDMLRTLKNCKSCVGLVDDADVCHEALVKDVLGRVDNFLKNEPS